jgi:hypothetical protein
MRRRGLGFCVGKGGGAGRWESRGRGSRLLIEGRLRDSACGPRRVGRRATAGLGLESEPSVRWGTSPTGRSHLAAGVGRGEGERGRPRKELGRRLGCAWRKEKRKGDTWLGQKKREGKRKKRKGLNQKRKIKNSFKFKFI